MKQMDRVTRDQIQFLSLEMMVAQDSIVRVLDVFMDYAMDHDLGFKVSKQKTGRPAYPIRTLLGIYVYGYLHKVRSSRALEKACQTNVELWWLLGGHKPSYKTIANFRKDNSKAFRELFKLYREFCKNLGLYGKETVAIDGSKFRAQNSKKNNYNKDKIDRHLQYIDTAEQDYLDALDEADVKETDKDGLDHARLKQLSERRIKYEDLKTQLEQSDQTQISTTDPDARALPLHRNIVEVGYNVQSSVDDKHNLIVDYQVTNQKDNDALAPMALQSKEALDLKKEDEMTVLADKGYHKGAQLKACHDNAIDTLVAVRDTSKQHKKTHVTKDKFTYDSQRDVYVCPQGKVLRKQATYSRKKDGKLVNYFDRYTIKHSICKLCPYHEDCVGKSQRKASQGKIIDRSEYQDAIDQNTANVKSRKEEYKRRQAIVEHPFGTVKRGWGYTYTLMKTIPKVEGEFSLIFLSYNLRRTMSILGLEGLKKALKAVFWSFLVLTGTVNPLVLYAHHSLHRAS